MWSTRAGSAAAAQGMQEWVWLNRTSIRRISNWRNLKVKLEPVLECDRAGEADVWS